MSGAIHDPRLPGLARATHPQAMAGLLYAALKETAAWPRGAIRLQVLKYKPGKHCVIRYQAQAESDSQRLPAVIGKLYRGERGLQRFRNMKALWKAAEDAAGYAPGLARPLAFLPALGIVLQSEVPGIPLGALPETADLPAAVTRTGRHLGMLHTLEVSCGAPKTMADHLAKYCHPGTDALAAAFPALHGQVRRILAGLQEAESGHPQLRCPVHGDLNLQQIFIDGEQVSFIDLDGFARAHPALDGGNLLSALAKYYPGSYPELEAAFFRGYRQTGRPEMAAGIIPYRALAALRRAMICFRKSPPGEAEAQIREYLNQSEALLAQEAVGVWGDGEG